MNDMSRRASTMPELFWPLTTWDVVFGQESATKRSNHLPIGGFELEDIIERFHLGNLREDLLEADQEIRPAASA